MEVTDIKYEGRVNIKLKLNNKVVSIASCNSGTSYLQKIICKFLSGYGSSESSIPQTIQLRKATGSSGNPWSSYVTCLNQEVYLSGKKYQEDTYTEGSSTVTGWIARFNASIPYSVIMQNTIVSGGSYRLYLVSDFDSNDMTERYHDIAYVDIAYSSLASITAGTQALIEWDMHIIL